MEMLLPALIERRILDMKQKAFAVIFGLYLISALSGCAMETVNMEVDTKIEEEGQTYIRAEREELETISHGNWTGPQESALTNGQKERIESYLNRYYEALIKLKMPEIEELFSDIAINSVIVNKNAWEYLIGLRAMQGEELALVDYKYDLTVTGVEKLEDGNVAVELTEKSTQNFSRHPEIDSELFNIRHYFVLEPAGQNWLIAEHQQRDGIYRNLLSGYDWNSLGELANADNIFSARKEELLNLAAQEKQQRDEEQQLELEWNRVSADHLYDRAAATKYAEEWVGKRNQEWSDFSGRGGNCQNFVSQCLFAGGIPMDTDGERVWKWYQEGINDGNNLSGNSTSWINVNAFHEYAAENTGYGLSAVIDCSYWEGKPGDLIQMGFPGNWNHTVIIADVVRDENERTVDYLIHSNTSDVKNFPISAYPLPCQELIRIIGWNEG